PHRAHRPGRRRPAARRVGRRHRLRPRAARDLRRRERPGRGPLRRVARQEGQPVNEGIYDGVPERKYHADPALSQSQAKTLLKAPALYRWELDNPRTDENVAFDIGTAAHAKVLGIGAEAVAIDVATRRGKAWTEPAEAARAGRAPIWPPTAHDTRDTDDGFVEHRALFTVKERQ